MITTSLEREYVTRILLFEINSVLKSLITAFTLKKNFCIVIKKRLKKLHQGVRTIIILMIFAGISLRLEKVGLTLKNCHPLQQMKERSLNAKTS